MEIGLFFIYLFNFSFWSISGAVPSKLAHVVILIHIWEVFGWQHDSRR